MTKLKTALYLCEACGTRFNKWAGQCNQCGAWNSLKESLTLTTPHKQATVTATTLAQTKSEDTVRMATGCQEFDRWLGGGLVKGSVVLLGGDPGVGKSTILLQVLASLSEQHTVLYVSAEESLQQVALRAKRLGLKVEAIHALSLTNVDTIMASAQSMKPQVMVIDSIQTVATEDLSSTPGSVAQVRECAARLVQWAKQSDIALFLVGHVTKEGLLAGPRVLEHMVDTVLYFEGQHDTRWRMIRAAKNRFGAANELGVFAMTEQGLKQVANPSAIFLSRPETPLPGSAILVTWEGSRPLLVEVQALVDTSHLANPRRVTVGVEQNRLSMLLAVLHRHGGVATHEKDIFVNVVGGVRVTETAADLAIMAAIISSLQDCILAQDLLIFGELGLSGEIRPVRHGVERLREAAKHGFRRALIPAANQPPGRSEVDLTVHPVAHIKELLSILFNNHLCSFFAISPGNFNKFLIKPFGVFGKHAHATMAVSMSWYGKRTVQRIALKKMHTIRHRGASVHTTYSLRILTRDTIDTLLTRNTKRSRGCTATAAGIRAIIFTRGNRSPPN